MKKYQDPKLEIVEFKINNIVATFEVDDEEELLHAKFDSSNLGEWD